MKPSTTLLAISRTCLVTLLILSFWACDKSLPGDDLGKYNINVTLESVSSKNQGSPGKGFIKFRQDPDTARIISLETWVFNLEPNHDYILQRAVNPITDADCSSIAWLTLGKGLVPQAIHTDGKGNGHEDLFRNITAIARETTFRIHFQVLDAVTLSTVLVSDCYQYTVR